MDQNRKQFIDRYWAIIEKDQNYTALQDYYASESVLIDPIYGPFEGRDAIAAFLNKVTEDMAGQNITFRVEETAGAGDIGWSRWKIQLPDGTQKDGVSVYRFKGETILYQQDYIGSHELT